MTLMLKSIQTRLGMAATASGGTAPKHLVGKCADPTQ